MITLKLKEGKKGGVLGASVIKILIPNFMNEFSNEGFNAGFASSYRITNIHLCELDGQIETVFANDLIDGIEDYELVN